MDIETIYDMYFKDVYVYLYALTKNKSLSEDITQDTFLKALKNIKQFDGSKDIRAWLFTIAKNTFYTSYKREKIYTSYEENEQSIEHNVLDTLIVEEKATQIHMILHEMKEPYKEVFMLRHFGELSFEKIAAIKGT